MIVELTRHNSLDEIKISVVYDTTERENAAAVKTAITKAFKESRIDVLETYFEDTGYQWYVEPDFQLELDLDYWYDFIVDALNDEIESYNYSLDYKAGIGCMQVYSLDM